jgi:hypothetical protein
MKGSKNPKFFSGTLAAVAVALAGTAGTQGWIIYNDDANNTFTFTIAGQAILIKAGEKVFYPIASDAASINGTGDYRVLSLDDISGLGGAGWAGAIPTALLADASVSTVKILDGALSADAPGRAKMAAGYFGLVAASIAHFVAGFWTEAAVTDKFADGAIVGAKLKNGALSADATGSGKMAAGFFQLTAASIAHFAADFFTQAFVAAKFAASSFDNTVIQKVMAAGAFGADVASRAAIAADFFNAATVLSKFATDCIDATNFAKMVVAGAIGHSKLKICTVVNLVDAAAQTLTAAQLCDSRLITTEITAARSHTTATAAAIVAAIPGAIVGTCVDFSIISKGAAAFDVTLLPGAGVTLVGKDNVDDLGQRSGTWRLRCDNVTGAAEAVSCIRIA